MPVLSERPLAEFPIGNVTLQDHHQRLTGITVAARAWIHPEDLSRLVPGSISTLTDESGTPLAWTGEAPDPSQSVLAPGSFMIVQTWDLLRANESWVGSISEDCIEGEVHANAVVEGTLQLGKGSRILPGVYLEGNVIIGENCKIGPNCYIRGNTSIGDKCHIGQSVEIKNSIILSRTNVGHLSYVGDSILGADANLGAGTITSNFRHDGGNHRTMVDGELVDTGRRKFGTIIGDRVHTGINTSIYPGRKLFAGTSTLPGAIVSRDVQ